MCGVVPRSPHNVEENKRAGLYPGRDIKGKQIASGLVLVPFVIRESAGYSLKNTVAYPQDCSACSTIQPA
jgi:hypothetical protein